MCSFYEAHCQDFLKIRDFDFPVMKKIGNYFIEMYASCKTIERRAMAGDIVKIHDCVVVFFRDLLVSNNGYNVCSCYSFFFSKNRLRLVRRLSELNPCNTSSHDSIYDIF